MSGELAVRKLEAALDEAVAELFDAHAASVGRTLRCLGVPEREVGDALQEVFVVVHRRLGEFAGRAKLTTWLHAICLRIALEHRRRGARNREDTVAEVPDASGTDGATPEAELEKRRALALALEVLEELHPEKRTIFVLYCVEQLPMSEVAEIAGCPLQTAYSRLAAARSEIQRVLRRMRAQGRIM